MSIGVKVATYQKSGIVYTRMKFNVGAFENAPLVAEDVTDLTTAENLMIQEIVGVYNDFSELEKKGTANGFQQRVVKELSDIFLVSPDKPSV